jgi:hypothetical protein
MKTDLKRLGVRAWTGFMCPVTGSREHGDEMLGLKKKKQNAGNFLTGSYCISSSHQFAFLLLLK